MKIHTHKELASYFRSYRKKHKLSQQDIAEVVGLKQSTVSAFEKKPESTKLNTLFRLLSAVGLEINISSKNSSFNKNNWHEEW